MRSITILPWVISDDRILYYSIFANVDRRLLGTGTFAISLRGCHERLGILDLVVLAVVKTSDRLSVPCLSGIRASRFIACYSVQYTVVDHNSTYGWSMMETHFIIPTWLDTSLSHKCTRRDIYDAHWTLIKWTYSFEDTWNQ